MTSRAASSPRASTPFVKKRARDRSHRGKKWTRRPRLILPNRCSRLAGSFSAPSPTSWRRTIEAAVIEPILVLGIPVDFILFALTLLGVALFHHHTLPIALVGLAAITGYKPTTMMWIAGVSPLSVLEAYVAAGVAVLIFAAPAAMQQQRFSPIIENARRGLRTDWTRVFIVAAIIIAALVVNVVANLKFHALTEAIPILGLTVWAVIFMTAPLRRPDWKIMPETFKGTTFLLALVTAASLMPVERLPAAGWQTALGLGFVSAVFDNIPLTALALKQGGYDWGYLAYAVGFGGSMIWFGSSAGVAFANLYPQAKSVGLWLRHGWHVALAYVIGFFVLYAVLGWHPNPLHKTPPAAQTPSAPAYSAG